MLSSVSNLLYHCRAAYGYFPLGGESAIDDHRQPVSRVLVVTVWKSQPFGAHTDTTLGMLREKTGWESDALESIRKEA